MNNKTTLPEEVLDRSLVFPLDNLETSNNPFVSDFWQKQAQAEGIVERFDDDDSFAMIRRELNKHGVPAGAFLGRHDWKVSGYQCFTHNPFDDEIWGNALEAEYTADDEIYKVIYIIVEDGKQMQRIIFKKGNTKLLTLSMNCRGLLFHRLLNSCSSVSIG